MWIGLELSVKRPPAVFRHRNRLGWFITLSSDSSFAHPPFFQKPFRLLSFAMSCWILAFFVLPNSTLLRAFRCQKGKLETEREQFYKTVEDYLRPFHRANLCINRSYKYNRTNTEQTRPKETLWIANTHSLSWPRWPLNPPVIPCTYTILLRYHKQIIFLYFLLLNPFSHIEVIKIGKNKS